MESTLSKHQTQSTLTLFCFNCSKKYRQVSFLWFMNRRIKQYKPSKPDPTHNKTTIALHVAPSNRMSPRTINPRKSVTVTNGINNPAKMAKHASPSVVQALFRTYSWKTNAALSLVVIMCSAEIIPSTEYVVVFDSLAESSEDTNVEGETVDMLAPLVVMCRFNSKNGVRKLL